MKAAKIKVRLSISFTSNDRKFRQLVRWRVLNDIFRDQCSYVLPRNETETVN